MQPVRSVVIALAAAMALAACAKPEAPPPALRTVIAQVVGTQPGNGANIYSGEVRARYENDLAFRVGGKVVARFVDVGATVKKGQPLARLDPQDARLAAEAARSALAAAQADHVLATAEVERYRDLSAKKFVSQAVLDARETTFNTTKARLEQARAQLATAQNQSSYTTLVAESDGVITAANVEPGQVVSAGQTVMRFARPAEKEVVINVPESRLAELREANQIAVAVLAVPERPYAGVIREVAPNADPATRTFAVKITLLDSDAAVQLGMTANVALGERGARDTINVPLTALTQIDGNPAVWIVDPGTSKVNLRPVMVGAYREDGATVSAGLRAGEVVVTAGVHKLLAGETVRVESDAIASPRAQQRLEAALQRGG
ncbi:MAG TPA: efflux RND transporter periplasmic adaptor subunit [Burkholderiales bacterium]|nr:efflux RND transporter periplasmic adaptor subunit [Burkholderiales bacterium]